MRKQFRELSNLDEAIAVLESLAIEPSREQVTLSEAHGRILAERIESPMDVPGFDRSIMDGYAVRADDTIGAYDDDPVQLAYVGKIVPGERPTLTVESGQAAEIATGAMVPDGADAVVKVEDTSRDGDTVSIIRPSTPQEYVMSQGADIATGETVLRPGTYLDARRIGLLAAIGLDKIPVMEAPRVGIISTGSELVRPTERDHLEVGEIFDINSFSMAASIEEAGAIAEIYPHVEDEYERIRETFELAADECDIVVSSGSTSASAEDVVYRIVEDAGELLLHGIAVKPGKPTVFGQIGDTPVLGMPGNPISALMNFRLFVRPLLQWAMDEHATRLPHVEATIATEMDSVGGRTQLSPVGLIEDPERGVIAYSVDKGSGAITSLADADGYVTIPDDTHYLTAGSTAKVTLLDERVTPPDVLCCGDASQIVDRAIDTCSPDIRYLDEGGVDGLRKLRDGVADIAVVGVPSERIESFDLSGIEHRRGYEHHLGFIHDGSWSMGQLETGTTVGTLPRESGVATHLGHQADTNDWSVDIRHRPSQGGIISAIADDEVDVAFSLESVASEHDLMFESIRWVPVDLFVNIDRQEKPGVEELIDAIDHQITGELVGFEKREGFGGSVET